MRSGAEAIALFLHHGAASRRLLLARPLLLPM